jgi:CAAX prenyl protease-like protein
MRTLQGALTVEDLQELFWRYFGNFGFFGSSHLLMFGATSSERAYLAPFFAFLAVLAVGSTLAHLFDGYAFWMASAPRYWIYPLQTLLCAGLLVQGWRWYGLRAPRRPAFAVGLGGLALVLWISPQQWLGFPPRLDGFEPAFFGAEGWPYWLHLGLRFFRLVIVVPLVEEIFWRGFLLRYLIRQDFTSVPMGAFSWRSFAIVTAGFCLEHGPADWPAAIATGVLYNLVAYRTRSLSACVLAHAVTNALLGGYILHTSQWGFW